MNTIVTEGLISFKELEVKIYDYICGLGREIAQLMLERYDAELRDTRDKSALRCKGKRKTTIKTIFGEVVYERNLYETKNEEGQRIWVYLLDILTLLFTKDRIVL